MESKVGEGSIFRVMMTCPAAQAPIIEADQADQLMEGHPIYTEGEALVIDDNPLNGTLLDLALKGRGITAVYCSSGREGLAAAEDQVFDIIFCDLHMPEMDGAQVVKELKNNPLVQAYETPIIAFTANVQSEDRKLFEELGVHSFLLKPFNQAQLDELLRKHLPEADFDVAELLPDAVTPAVESTNLFSLRQIRQFTGDDTDALISYLETFITTAEQSGQRLTVALQEKSMEETSFHAHKLVSQVELLQVMQLASRLKYLERTAENSSWNEDLEHQLQLAINEIEQLIKNIHSTVRELKSTPVD